METATFERVRALIRDMAGISLSPAKRTMVANRLGRRLRRLILGLRESRRGGHGRECVKSRKGRPGFSGQWTWLLGFGQRRARLSFVIVIP